MGEVDDTPLRPCCAQIWQDLTENRGLVLHNATLENNLIGALQQNTELSSSHTEFSTSGKNEVQTASGTEGRYRVIIASGP